MVSDLMIGKVMLIVGRMWRRQSLLSVILGRLHSPERSCLGLSVFMRLGQWIAASCGVVLMLCMTDIITMRSTTLWLFPLSSKFTVSSPVPSTTSPADRLIQSSSLPTSTTPSPSKRLSTQSSPKHSRSTFEPSPPHRTTSFPPPSPRPSSIPLLSPTQTTSSSTHSTKRNISHTLSKSLSMSNWVVRSFWPLRMSANSLIRFRRLRNYYDPHEEVSVEKKIEKENGMNMHSCTKSNTNTNGMITHQPSVPSSFPVLVPVSPSPIENLSFLAPIFVVENLPTFARRFSTVSSPSSAHWRTRCRPRRWVCSRAVKAA